MNTETEILFGIVLFLAILGTISTLLPAKYQILNLFDFTFLSGSIIGVGAACGVITGGFCAAALGIFGVANFIVYVILPNASTFQFIKPLIIIPITLMISYIISRLGRGGG
jgi:hypothetical protein